MTEPIFLNVHDTALLLACKSRYGDRRAAVETICLYYTGIVHDSGEKLDGDYKLARNEIVYQLQRVLRACIPDRYTEWLEQAVRTSVNDVRIGMGFEDGDFVDRYISELSEVQVRAVDADGTRRDIVVLRAAPTFGNPGSTYYLAPR